MNGLGGAASASITVFISTHVTLTSKNLLYTVQRLGTIIIA